MYRIYPDSSASQFGSVARSGVSLKLAPAMILAADFATQRRHLS